MRLQLDGSSGFRFKVDGTVRCDELGDSVLERFDAFSRDGGDRIEGKLAALGHGCEFFKLVGVGDVGFGGDEDGGFSGEGWVEAFEFVGDDFVVVDRIRAVGSVGDIDEVDNDAGALDVFEELDAEAVAEMRTFDEAGEVGDGEGFGVGEFADLDYAEVGFERGEGVVGDFGPGGGEARDEGGFADVRIANESGIGEEAELEAIVALFAGAAKLVLSGSLMGAGGEVLVAAASAAALGDDDGFVGAGEVVDEFAGVVVEEEGADGDFESRVLASLAGAVGAEAVSATLGFVLGVETEVDERVVAEGGGHEDVASMASVAAGGAAFGHELFAAEGHTAVAAVPCFNADFCFVNEHDSVSSVLGEGCGVDCGGVARTCRYLGAAGWIVEFGFLI